MTLPASQATLAGMDLASEDGSETAVLVIGTAAMPSVANYNVAIGYMALQHVVTSNSVIFLGEPELPEEAQPDPSQPDTLGWRAWKWNCGTLVSPIQFTPWLTNELRVENWSDDEAVWGAAGIHARRMPKDWTTLDWPGPGDGPEIVTGIVERFGRYVLGDKGWRAEWVIIRALRAPSTEIGLALEAAYPDVPVIYPREESDGYR